eukprot:CAMPEP_0174233840 /NCGR_PEP_ID=MMETSP0417-20130205/3774_1 /TAXON_ID=242541 /ORGANISM="Mayorella sp, Strain BSH-02190019" /LENGTH=475 /DNA_ID=CAMNT_0015312121 /DNA_START=90 /DNA_END=1517 /DNA_ORIENTATION=+
MMTRRASDRYVTLREIRERFAGRNKFTVNLLAVIKSISLPKTTSRGTLFCCMELVDASSDEPFKVNTFARSVALLPIPAYVGSICCAHDLNVGEWNDHAQGTIAEKFSSWAIFSGARTDALDPVQKSNEPFRPTARLPELVEALRIWASTQLHGPSLRVTAQVNNRYVRTFAELDRRSDFQDVICRLVESRPLPSSASNQRRVRCIFWDGTKNDQIEASASEPGFPEASLLPVNAVEYQADNLSSLPPGTWVHLQSLNIKTYCDQIEGDVTRTTKINVLSQDDPQVQLAFGRYLERATEFRRVNELSLSHITMSCSRLPIVSIRYIHEHPLDATLFRTFVRVLGHEPKDVRDFVRPFCHSCSGLLPFRCNAKLLTCQKCNIDCPEPAYSYLFKLHVEDATGHLTILVAGLDGDCFFTRPPSNLYRDAELVTRIQTFLSDMLTPGRWLECLVRSYVPSGETKERKYRMFETILYER